MLCKYFFSQSFSSPFVLLPMSFRKQKFNFKEQFIKFLLYGLSFWCHVYRNICLVQGHRFSPMFSSRSFMVLIFIFESVVHFNFCIWWRIGQKFYILAHGCPIVLVPLVEKTIYSPLHFLCNFVKTQLSVYAWACFRALFCAIPLFLHLYVNTILS